MTRKLTPVFDKLIPTKTYLVSPSLISKIMRPGLVLLAPPQDDFPPHERAMKGALFISTVR
jgi:hypothetical protein